MAKAEKIGNLRDALALANGRLREAYADYEALLYAAITGEGLEEIRNNQYLQAAVRQIVARKNMPPPLRFPRPRPSTEAINEPQL